MEAKNFQRDLTKYNQAGAVILGVSVDSAQSHKDFCAKEGLNFKLLSDPDAKVSALYGSTMDYKGAKMAARNTFIINPKGDIAKVFVGVKPTEHSDEVLKALADLNGRPQSPGFDSFDDQLVELRFDNRASARVDNLNLERIHIHSDHLVTIARKTSRGNRPYVSQSKNAQFHLNPRLSRATESTLMILLPPLNNHIQQLHVCV